MTITIDWKVLAANMPASQSVSYHLIKKLVELKVMGEDDAFGVIAEALDFKDKAKLIRKRGRPRAF